MTIRQLEIKNYRGIESWVWVPGSGINCLIGPGDAGKTTVLYALALLLTTRPSASVSEYDYFRRRVDQGFMITAVIGDLDESIYQTLRVTPTWGWKDGKLKAIPEGDDEPVLVARVSGSSELEVSHQLVAPTESGEGDQYPFPPSTRRRLLLTQIVAESRAMNELRLARGTLLDRTFGDVDILGGLSSSVAAASAGLDLPQEMENKLQELRASFAQSGLPCELHLGLIIPQERTLLGMVGLLSGAPLDEAIPFAFAGTGTTQLALFQLGAALIGQRPIIVLDEVEAGLEPYRQRRLVRNVRELIGSHGQAFLTTHSPAILNALTANEVTRMEQGKPQPVQLDHTVLSRLFNDDPDVFLSRLPILCEGPTEAGLLSEMLDSMAEEDGVGSLDALGLSLSARHGQPQVLDEADGLLNSGIHCGLFVDAEHEHSGRRQSLEANDRCAFGTWAQVRNIEEAVSKWLPVNQLPRLVEVAAHVNDRPLESFFQQVGEAAGQPGKVSIEKLVENVGEHTVRSAIERAMQATSGHAWFKSLEGGRVLGRLLLELGPPTEIDSVIRDFWKSLRLLLG